MEKSQKNLKYAHILEFISILLILYGCYFNAVKTISLSYTVYLILGIIFMGIAFFVERRKKIFIFLPTIIFTIVIFASSIFSIVPNNTNRMAIIYTLFMIITMLIFPLNDWKKYLLGISLVFSTITVFVTILSWISTDMYIEYILPNIYLESQEDMYNLVVYANSFPGIFASTGLNAFYISIGIAIIVSNLLPKDNLSNKKKILYIILLLCFILALFLTLKRATIVINVGTVLLILLLNKKIKLKTVLIGIVALVIIIVIAFNTMPDVINNLLSRFEADSTEDLLNGRGDLYDFAIDSFVENPFSGFGFGGFSTAYRLAKNYNGITLDTHNEILQLLSEVGIIGTLLVIIPMILCYINTIRNLKKCRNNEEKVLINISIYVQTYFLIYAFVGNPLHDTSLYLMYTLMTLVNFSVLKGVKESEEKKDSISSNSNI